MTLEEFIEVVGNNSSVYRLKKDRYVSDIPKLVDKKDITAKDFFREEWVCGGITGGSCWGSENLRGRTAEPEPEFTAVDTLLELLVPDIKFLQYKKLAHIFSENEYTILEYYGNSTEYRYKWVTIEDLYNKLVELELIRGD